MCWPTVSSVSVSRMLEIGAIARYAGRHVESSFADRRERGRVADRIRREQHA